MKYNKIILGVIAITAIVLMTSCDKFLDELPDNRTELNSYEKIRSLLVTAYPQNAYVMIAERSSDNVDDYGSKNPYWDRIDEQIAYWKDITETDNEDAKSVWSACYTAIASANLALEAIEKEGTPDQLLPAKGEALLCRAYGHFILVNMFAKHYNKSTSATDLGVTYMSAPEKTLNPKYKRESVADIYSKINKDIEEGLPLIDDAFYSVPKYHFNTKAAFAFAARFNLYYENWDKVIDYASSVLTVNPKVMLRDNAGLAATPRNFQNWANAYISENNSCNLLLLAVYSNLGYVMGNYYAGSRFAHGSTISKNETIEAVGPWGAYTSTTYQAPPYIYSGTNLNKALFAKVPALFQYTDPVQQIGFRRTVVTAFTADEVLLCRAEAYAMKKDYDNATADLALWKSNFVRVGAALTRSMINSFYSALPYYTPTSPTIKKKLNPSFTVEAGEQENFIQCVLHFRRLETLLSGLRWFDVKRYGIEVPRRLIDGNGNISVVETLSPTDPRRAIQIPKDVTDSGYTPNPR